MQLVVFAKKDVKAIIALKEVCMLSNVSAQLFASFKRTGFQQVKDNKFLIQELTKRLSQFEGDDFKNERFDKIREFYQKEAKMVSGRPERRSNQRIARFFNEAHEVIDKIYWDYWEQVLKLELPLEVAERRK